MELQLKHRVELLLEEERVCLEHHEKELAVRRSQVLYHHSVSGDGPAPKRKCSMRSTAPRRAKRTPNKRFKPRTQDMILEGLYWSDESEPESVEDGCLLMGLTQDIIDLD